MNIYIDIETIPDQSPGARQGFIDAVEAPGQYKKPESIQKWKDENAETEGDNQWRRTALNGSRGEIFCIGYALNDAPASVIRGDTERDTLQIFGEVVSATLRHSSVTPYFIGHNVLSFDLRFLWQRYVVNGIRPGFKIPHTDRPGGNNHFDTMHEWAGWGNRISQDNLAKALGLPGKPNDIDGSKVWDFVSAGEHKKVMDYCLDDVEQVREIYKRLTFSEVAA